MNIKDSDFVPVNCKYISMLKDLRFILAKYWLDVLPFFAAFLITPPLNQTQPNQVAIVRLILENYLVAVVLFITWRSFRILYVMTRKKYRALWTDYTSLIVLALLTAVLLQILKTKIPLNWFYLTCCLLIAIFLSDFYENRKLILFSCISKFIYFILLGFLSFILYGLEINIVVFAFCISISFISMAQYLALLAFQENLIFGKLDTGIKERLWTLAFTFCLILSPVIIIGISVFKYLPSRFCLVSVLLPICAYLISGLNLNDRSSLELKRLFISTSGISVMFAVIILVLRTF